MYTPTKLTLINFGSHKYTEYTFSQNQTSLLCGINETDQGQKSNGSGKSWIIEGVFYAITTSALRKQIKDNDLVYDNEKYSEITLILENKVIDQTLEINRKIYSNTKSGELTIKVNGVAKTDLPSVAEGNKFILDQLGLSREDLVDYFIISKDKYTSFFSSSDTAKKELINRFSKADIIDPIDDSIKGDISDQENKKLSLDNELIHNNTKIQTYLESSEDDPTKHYQQKIENNKQQINSLSQQIQQNQPKIEQLDQEIQNAQNIIQQNQPKLTQLKDNQKEYDQLLNDIEKSLSEEVECPKCHHKFSFKDKTIPLTELRENLPLVQESIKDVIFEQMQLNDDIEQAQKALSLAKNERQELQFDIQGKQREISILQSENTSLQNNKPQQDNILQKIEALENANKQIESDINDITKLITSYNEWLINFKRFKGYLANKSLSAIQSYANFYLQQLKTDITIEIDGYKEIKGGKEIREKINVKVLRGGIDKGSFSKLSGGEKARIEISIILAMQKLINVSTQGRGLNFILLDEILESVDILGIEILVRSLNDLNLNIMLITQQVTVEREGDNYLPNINCDNLVIVTKKNKISEII